MIQFLTIWVFSLTIFQVFLAIKAQTCSTGCTPMVNAGTSSTVLNPGQLCLLTGTTNGCSYTNATCTGFSTSVQTSLAAQLKSTLQATRGL
uniref:Secreted protein n=1 Tax=Acrobeloides nanus TaxID=290746 RepID=A0A914D286_9BILA